MITRVGFGKHFVPATSGVIKFSAVDDYASNRGAVAADEFGSRVNHDVSPVVEGSAEIGSGNSVIDHQRNPFGVGHFRDALKIDYVAFGVTHGLRVERAGVGLDVTILQNVAVGIDWGWALNSINNQSAGIQVDSGSSQFWFTATIVY